MRHRRRIPPTGELRQSQVVTTFGPGSMVDLPDYAVLIGGLDEWRGERQRIYEERMEAWITELLKLDQIALYAPPVEDADQTGPQSGIPAIQFPTWFLAQVKETYTDEHGKEYRTRPLVPWKHLRDGKYYLSEDRKKIPVVPVRFVQACVRGHISDVAWYDFVRAEKNA
ncbi:MAG: hypothetical protein Q8N53_07400, partial [Longimicrobiales bacterium]|nr:hypothetical protein [Longimicrobiales bacterium]